MLGQEGPRDGAVLRDEGGVDEELGKGDLRHHTMNAGGQTDELCDKPLDFFVGLDYELDMIDVYERS